MWLGGQLRSPAAMGAKLSLFTSRLIAPSFRFASGEGVLFVLWAPILPPSLCVCPWPANCIVSPLLTPSLARDLHYLSGLLANIM